MNRKRRVSLREASRYRVRASMLTYILHRIGGISLVLFLVLRILISMLLRQPQSAPTGIFIGSIFASWPFQVYITFFVLFHVINGLRIVILDLRPKLIERQPTAVWVEWAVFLPIWAALMYMIVHTRLEG